MLLNFAAAMASYSALGQQHDAERGSLGGDDQESFDGHQQPSPGDLRAAAHSPVSSGGGGGGPVPSHSSDGTELENRERRSAKRKGSEIEEGL